MITSALVKLARLTRFAHDAPPIQRRLVPPQ